MKASQKVGADTPISETARATWSIQVSRFIAASTPERQADQQRQQEGDGGELDRGRRVLRDVLQHRPLRGDGDAEIAMREAAQEDPVAIPQRQVEAPFVAKRRDHGRVVGRDVAKLGQHRIARHRVGDQEDDQRRQQHHRRGNQQDARRCSAALVPTPPRAAAYRMVRLTPSVGCHVILPCRATMITVATANQGRQTCGKLAGSAGAMWCACSGSAARHWQRGCRTACMRRASGGTLVLGIDISDSITFDPAREAQYTAPLSLRAAYESLVTMSPGDYLEVKPALAKTWEQTAGRQGLALPPGATRNSTAAIRSPPTM